MLEIVSPSTSYFETVEHPSFHIEGDSSNLNSRKASFKIFEILKLFVKPN